VTGVQTCALPILKGKPMEEANLGEGPEAPHPIAPAEIK
jgi:hypothetical protein